MGFLFDILMWAAVAVVVMWHPILQQSMQCQLPMAIQWHVLSRDGADAAIPIRMSTERRARAHEKTFDGRKTINRCPTFSIYCASDIELNQFDVVVLSTCTSVQIEMKTTLALVTFSSRMGIKTKHIENFILMTRCTSSDCWEFCNLHHGRNKVCVFF